MLTLTSTYIKKKDMHPAFAQELANDIFAFETLLRTTVYDLPHDLRRKSQHPHPNARESLHRQYKQAGLTDYFVTSLERTAKGIVDAAKEALALDIKTKEQQAVRIAEKINRKKVQLNRVASAKASLAARNRARKNGGIVPPFENPFGKFVTKKVTKEGLSFTVGSVHGKRPPDKYENEYLFEHLYLNPRARKLKMDIHFMEHRLHNLKRRLERLKREQAEGILHICFGGKKLLRQRQAVKNGTQLHDWQRMWDRRRHRDMLLVGRHDSIGGNFIARYDTNSHTLRYRSIQGRQIDIPNVRFLYGQDWVDAAVNAHDIAMRNKKLPPDQQIEGWKPGPVTWAIKDCGDAIQVKCMISLPADPHINSCYSDGCVAFDMNYDNFAVSETGPEGELLEHYVVPFQMEGRTSGQITNAISESLEKIFRHAASVNKPVAMEDIEHPDKCLLYGNKRANHKISEFAHSKVTYLAERKGQKYHLNVKKVNPAYTSQIGKLKYMCLLGLSVHESAAYVIGRRAMGLKDKVPKGMFHLIPEKAVRRHHWAHWSALYTALKKVPVSKFYRKINYHEYETPAALKKALLK